MKPLIPDFYFIFNFFFRKKYWTYVLEDISSIRHGYFVTYDLTCNYKYLFVNMEASVIVNKKSIMGNTFN